jgi:hypothetical protein
MAVRHGGKVETQTCRLVMRNDETGAVAALFSGDATMGSTPIASFVLPPHQRLPRVAPGAQVEVRGELRRGSPLTVTARAGAGTIQTVLGRRYSNQTLIEREDVVADPEVIAWERSWRYPLGSRRTIAEAVADWKLDKARARGEVVSAFIRLLVATLFVLGAAAAPWWGAVLLAGVSVPHVWRAWTLIRTAISRYRHSVPRITVARAIARSPGVVSSAPGVVAAWRWCAGFGDGPMLIALLDDVWYEVMGVPDRFDTSRPTDVVVETLAGVMLPRLRIGSIELLTVASWTTLDA